jgi:hypothetical protein
MLHVNLDMYPWGSKENKKHIGTLDIINDGSGDEHSGNYRVVLKNGNGVIVKMKYITNYPRDHGAWYLVGLAIQYLEEVNGVTA